ncbi:Poly(A) RNA polymerase like protein [Argiope bruennichi]|uniref:Poly(A) RNA polymerase like protein n=1 Tax=Argiope bruennichi TaxID=94029 RepID=A0A8T0ENT1_ARGBR|nr:Poly(A) RNA polymerase like protein [Argiope bruennichi]
MLLRRCLKCSSYWVVRQSSKRVSLYCSASRVVVNKQFCKVPYCQFPYTLQHKSWFSTSPVHMKKRKPKGWKGIIEDGEIPLRKNYACESGKDAVPHSVLVSKLQSCSSVSEQIETFSAVLNLTNEDKEKRKDFCRWLEDVFKVYLDHKLYQFGSSVTGMGFKGCDLDVCLLKNFSDEFGSSVTGMGFKGCDLDVCLLTNFNDEESGILADVPTVEDVESGLVSREIIAHLNPLHMTKFLKSVLEKHPDITDVVRINGRCPILKFYSSRHDIFCDLSFKNQFSLQNTALIKFLGKLDERFLIITRIVRYWAKYCGLVDGLDKFSSYALSMLVLHFLQTRDPPILLPANEIISKSEYVQSGSIEDTQLLTADLKKFSPSNNSKSVEKLLREFFFYYLDFDFNQVIVPATGCSVPVSSFMAQKDFDKKFEFNTVTIQDPFRPDVNITVATVCRIARKYCTDNRSSTHPKAPQRVKKIF